MTEAAPTGTKRRTGLAAYRLVVIAFFVIVTGAAAIFFGSPAFVCACSSTAPPARPSTSVPPSPVVGVVVFIDQESLTKVKSFDVRTPDGETVTLKVGVLDNATQFSLSHLATHMATGVPIRAFYRLERGEPVVYHLEDALPAIPSPATT